MFALAIVSSLMMTLMGIGDRRVPGLAWALLGAVAVGVFAVARIPSEWRIRSWLGALAAVALVAGAAIVAARMSSEFGWKDIAVPALAATLPFAVAFLFGKPGSSPRYRMAASVLAIATCAVAVAFGNGDMGSPARRIGPVLFVLVASTVLRQPAFAPLLRAFDRLWALVRRGAFFVTGSWEGDVGFAGDGRHRREPPTAARASESADEPQV